MGKGQQFETITDAVKYIGRMTRTTERVTITLTDALYREQVMVDTPYVTISSEAGSTITWYYGSGYTYYSADMNGYYSEARAVDKYEKELKSEWVQATGEQQLMYFLQLQRSVQKVLYMKVHSTDI